MDEDQIDQAGSRHGDDADEVDDREEPGAEEEKEEESKDDDLDPNGRKIIVFTEEEKKANIDRVQFTPAVPKQIISKHSGSILVKPEPTVALSRAVLENATRVFETNIPQEETAENPDESAPVEEGKEAAEEKSQEPPPPRTIHRSRLADLLAECGYSAARVCDICNRLYSGPEEMEVGDFIDFFTRFYAPSFYYGQRLRRFVGRGEMEEVFDLLARGCDVNAGDGEGLCPLHYAAMYNRASAISDLVKYAPDTIAVDALDRYGWSPLHCACQHGNLDCVLSLLNAGANIRIADKNGKTPLHVAACQARYNIVDALVEKDPSLMNIQDNRGMTPVHDAAFKGHQKTYFYLTNAGGANLQIKDILGNTCADYVNITEDEISGGESKR